MIGVIKGREKIKVDMARGERGKRKACGKKRPACRRYLRRRGDKTYVARGGSKRKVCRKSGCNVREYLREWVKKERKGGWWVAEVGQPLEGGKEEEKNRSSRRRREKKKVGQKKKQKRRRRSKSRRREKRRKQRKKKDQRGKKKKKGASGRNERL